MDKSNVFKAGPFYLASGDIANVSYRDAAGPTLYVELTDSDAVAEDSAIILGDEDNLISAWTNGAGANAYDTFTTSAAKIDPAITDGSATCYAQSDAFSVRVDAPIVVTFTLQVNSGTKPNQLFIRNGVAGAIISNVGVPQSGANAIVLTPTVSSDLAVLEFTNTAAAGDWESLGQIVTTRQYDYGTISLTATTDGVHYIYAGVDAGVTFYAGLRMYIVRTGAHLVEWMQGLGIGWISMIGTELWKHNSDNVPRCNFFGEQKDMVVGLVFNEALGEIKVLDSMEIHSTGEWVVDSIELPATLNYPNGMYSKIPQNIFRNREGVLYAEFMRNMKSADGTVRHIQALKGEELRGDSAYMVLRNTSTSEVSLFKVRINATTSR